MNKFRNEDFNELYEFMKRMDASDDYLMIQVSTFNQNKADMEMRTLCTGRSGGKPVVNSIEAEAALILAMEKIDAFRWLLTNVVMDYEKLQALKRRQKS